MKSGTSFGLGAALWVATAALGAPAAAETSLRTVAGPGWEAPMRLGHPAPKTQSSDARAEKAEKQTRCRRWRAMARQLGETYAGHALRTSVIQRNCESPVGARYEDAVWDWPWGGLPQARLSPPRLHRTFGAWQIRCGTGAWRHRCAAAATLPLVPSPGDEARPPASILAHFVIDMIAGRESVLWRVFMPTTGGDVGQTAEAGAGAQIASTSVARDGTRFVRYNLAGREQSVRFVVCAAPGCLMEADLVRSSEAATSLWDGTSIDVEVIMGERDVGRATLPGAGFREALRELVRLRRDEGRSPPR